MSLQEFEKARNKVVEANKFLAANAKTVIEKELKEVFEDPSINNVQWAQKASEYNDEGMYPGVFGPVINEPTNFEEANDDYDYYWPDWLQGYTDNPDPRLVNLKKILDSIGDEILSEIYGDEHRVTVTRRPSVELVFTSEYNGV